LRRAVVGAGGFLFAVIGTTEWAAAQQTGAAPGSQGGEAASPQTSQSDQATEEITVTAKRLDQAQIGIEPQIGASTYSFSSDAISNLPGGVNVPLNDVLLRAPGVDQDNLANGALHVRNEHLNVQYRINGVALPEGVSFFGQGISPRFADQLSLITGTLPAEYGLRTAGIVDIQTKSGIFQPGGSVGMYGGSYDTVQPSFEYGGSAPGGWNYYAAGDYFSSSHGIDAPTPSYNAIHDDTQQTHGFFYLDKILDSASRLTFMAGTFNGQFQIPNNPGQVPPGTFMPGGVATVDSGFLTEHQTEGNQYGIVSYLRSQENFDFQVSGYTKYGQLHFHPDPLGDLIYNGIAQDAVRTSFANGVQADGSYKLRTDHTLRGGLRIEAERAAADAASSVLPIATCTAAGDLPAAGCPTSGAATFGTTPLTIEDNHAKTGWTYSTYVQDEWRILPKVTLNYGARFDVVNTYTQENAISPRLNAVWKPTDATTVHAGYARYFTPPPFELISGASLSKFVATSATCVPNCVNDPVKSERSHYFDVGVQQVVIPGLTIGVDAYYKYARNLLDEGQFGAPVILTPFNYHVGFNRGVELSTSYTKGNFSYYGNLAIAEQKAEGITSAQFNFSAADLAYIASHLINTDHSQRMTASAGMAYLWHATRFSVDVIAGTGLRTQEANNVAPNGSTVPSYEQVNLGVSHKFDLPYAGSLDVRFDVINVLDEVYVLRSQGGIGVFASQYGPRRTFFAGVKKEF
jgi:outer membrane receptor protein involved in Fe transport